MFAFLFYDNFRESLLFQEKTMQGFTQLKICIVVFSGFIDLKMT